MQSIKTYLTAIETGFSTGKATEHTYRLALQNLLEGCKDDVKAVNEPRRIQCGAPDFVVLRSNIPFGYVECKDIAVDLDSVEKTEQLRRYLNSLPNLLLTNYLEFRWYLSGEIKSTIEIGRLENGALKAFPKQFRAIDRLIDSFLSCDAPIIGTTKELAEHMAKTAQLIRIAIETALKMEDRGGTLHQQIEAFRKTLLHDITVSKFADMYAQTICYGLFMARANHSSGRFTRQMAPFLLPKSNPFLREMFDHIAGIHLDDRIVWAVDNLAELFHNADMHSILLDFGKRSSGKDPILHFYEDFLTAYDPRLRKSRGVYYTPEPAVSFIVRSVDKILKRDFNLSHGLADAAKIEKSGANGKRETVHKVQILDPAAGTGSFLHGVVDHIRRSFIGNEGLWQGYVDNDLLPRLFGFELLMAPYTIAHLKVGMLLKESAYEFKEDKRLKIYLTNSLEESGRHLNHTIMFGFIDWLLQEAEQARDIKSDAPVMVVLGNPPYSGHSENKGDWIKKLIQPYFTVDGKPLGEKNPKWVNNDYVKFIRFAQWKIEQTGYGVLAFITDHSYLDSPTFRGVRRSLMTTFDEIYLLDLHGNSNKKEKSPDGSKDECVFDIKEGVAIGLFVKQPIDKKRKTATKIWHKDIFGLRNAKYKYLYENDIDSIDWEKVKSRLPYYLFIPKDMNFSKEYEKGWSVNDIFQNYSVGIVTARDELTLKNTPDEQWRTVVEFSTSAPEEAREKFNLGNDSDWTVEWAQKDINQSGIKPENITPILYRPFDLRYTYYTGIPNGYHTRPRSKIMRNMVKGNNLGLLTSRQQAVIGFQHVFCTRNIIESCAVSNKTKEITYLYPLYLYPENEPRRSNLSPKYIAELTARIGSEPAPEEAFYYIYAVFHAPTYRRRYAEFLKMDFPRVILPPPDVELFRKLCGFGEELVGLHLMEREKKTAVKYPIAGDDIVGRIKYAANRVWINEKQFFEGVDQEVWEFRVGGYQVCGKWLKDRKNRVLTYDDIKRYMQISAAIGETIRLMNEIDDVMVKPFEWDS